jgi:hypothetical protein
MRNGNGGRELVLARKGAIKGSRRPPISTQREYEWLGEIGWFKGVLKTNAICCGQQQ